ncbi:MAG: hypothetical protein GY799_02005 [Desulfobulbaceae bacterium]|nr:hypothetical protein [Desulfobulbaceae bacterium]
MGVTIKTTGLSNLIQKNSQMIDEINKNVSRVMNDNGNATVSYAKKNHRFKSRKEHGARLENSVKFKYDMPIRNVHEAYVYLDPTFTTVGSGKSYGVFIHEGWGRGYSQSPIGKPYQSNGRLKGWGSDPFLYQAIEKKWATDRGLKGVATKIRRKYSTNG